MGNIYLTNRFQVVVRLFSNRSQMTSKCGKNKKVAHKAQLSVSLMCTVMCVTDMHCDVLYYTRRYNKELKKSFNDAVICTSVLQKIISENQSEYVHN